MRVRLIHFLIIYALAVFAVPATLAFPVRFTLISGATILIGLALHRNVIAWVPLLGLLFNGKTRKAAPPDRVAGPV